MSEVSSSTPATEAQQTSLTPQQPVTQNPVSATTQQNEKPLFDVKPEDFQPLYDPKNKKLLVEKFGGLDGICKLLKVDPSIGLSADEKLTSSDGKVADDQMSVVVKKKVWKTLKLWWNAEPELPYNEEVFVERSQHFGHNCLPRIRTRSIFEYMLMSFQDKILIMLTVAAVASLAVGLYKAFGMEGGDSSAWIEGVAIIFAVLIVVFVQSVNDYQKEKQFQALNAKKEQRKVKCLRSGQVVQVSVYDIQVGDVCLLEPGDLINVDGILVQAHNLKVDESSATGESDLINKQVYSPESDCKDPFILGGGKVNEGVGRFVVTSVGQNSFFGKTMMGLRVEPEPTPLQLKLNRLADSIAVLGIGAAILLLIVLTVKYVVASSVEGWGKQTGTEIANEFIKIVIETIIIIVVAVPEGLPLAVTLSLAYATKRMTRDNNLVRVLASCETMGGATTICSDKTGTLTQNEMTVVSGLIAHRLEFTEISGIAKLKEKLGIKVGDKSLADSSFNPNARSDKLQLSEFLFLLSDGLALNSTAFEEKDQNGKVVFVGNKTETALLGFIRRLGLENFQSVRDDSLNLIVQVYPFSSERKSMTTVVKRVTKQGPIYRAYTKGASEIILKYSDSFVEYSADKNLVYRKQLTKEYREEIQAVIGNYADQALRTIGISYYDYSKADLEALIGPFENADGSIKTFEEAQSKKLEADFTGKLTLLAIVGIEDPLREGVAEAVQKCQKAGVFVRMVTGDNLRTAKAIATKCGIYMKGGVVMEGQRFRKMNDKEMEAILPRLQVLARSSPTDKQILVRKLKEMGETVAVTGDGTNDGPALKMADVGFSMGIAGTEVAKEASSIILMDDNFSSIVKAMMWGRCVNDSVKKFLQFQLTVNISAVLLAFITAVSSSENNSVLTAIQLLWVNLIMDSLAALALATDPPTEEILDRYPEGKQSPLITIHMWKMIIGQAVFQVFTGLMMFYFGKYLVPARWATDSVEVQKAVGTFVFNTFVFFQLFNEINCRRIDNKFNIFSGILQNRYLQVIMVGTLVVQVIIVQYAGDIFKAYGLPWEMWIYSIGIGFLTWPVGALIRLVPVWDGCTLFGVGIAKPDNHRIVMTKGRLQWQDTIGKVRTQVSVFHALRGTGRFGNAAAYRDIEMDEKEEGTKSSRPPSIIPDESIIPIPAESLNFQREQLK